MPTLTEGLVAYLDARRDEACGPQARDLARYYLLDWLGALLAAHGTATGRKFSAYVSHQPEGSAPLVGLGRAAAPEVSAFFCGAMSHIVEMDDVAREAIIHPAVVVIPAALAVAADRGSNGGAFLTALVEGYEVAMLIGEAVGPEHYFHFHNTTTCGVFGAAAAASRLLSLDDRQQVWALGNAGTQAFGLWQFNAEGVLTKPFHSGRAAANGLSAALVAQEGISGASQILEGERGFFAGLAPKGEPQRIGRALEQAGPLKIGGVSIKPYASCRHTHAPIDAALRLRRQLGDAVKDIRSFSVASYQAALDLCNNPVPAGTAEAKFSLQYCVASALLRGDASLQAFEGRALDGSDAMALAQRGDARFDPEADRRYPVHWSATVSVTLDNGTAFEATAVDPKGDPENPLSAQELETKFRQLAAYGGFSDDQATGLIEWVTCLADDEPLDLAPLRVRPAFGTDTDG